MCAKWRPRKARRNRRLLGRFTPDCRGIFRCSCAFSTGWKKSIIAVLIAAATLVIFAAVVQRFAVGVPFLYPIFYPLNLTWAQELCIYMFIWMAKFGAAYGVRTGIHVGVDVLVNQLNPVWRKKVTILFGPALRRAVYRRSSAPWASSSSYGLYSTDQMSPDLEIPSWIVYACIPLGSYLMCFRFLQVCLGVFLDRRTAAS